MSSASFLCRMELLVVHGNVVKRHNSKKLMHQFQRFPLEKSFYCKITTTSKLNLTSWKSLSDRQESQDSQCPKSPSAIHPLTRSTFSLL
jgi:hypothetical protein